MTLTKGNNSWIFYAKTLMIDLTLCYKSIIYRNINASSFSYAEGYNPVSLLVNGKYEIKGSHWSIIERDELAFSQSYCAILRSAYVLLFIMLW